MKLKKRGKEGSSRGEDGRGGGNRETAQRGVNIIEEEEKKGWERKRV